MEAPSAPRGLILDLITPLNEDGSVDGRGLGRLIDRTAGQVQGILISGPRGGEGTWLGPEKRLDLLDKTLVVVRGQIPLLVWITGETEDDTTELLVGLRRRIERRKYTGRVFWVDTPLYYHSNRGLPALYGEFCSKVREPFLLHNDPELIKGLAKPFKRSNIRTAILKEMTTLKSLAGMVFNGSIDRARNYHRASRRRPGFRIYDGSEAHFLEHPSMSGVVSLGANLAPGAWQMITRSALQLYHDREDSPYTQQRIWEIGGYLLGLRDAYAEAPVPAVKEALCAAGIIETPFTFYEQEGERVKQDILDLMARYEK